jgi:hypothetical protein
MIDAIFNLYGGFLGYLAWLTENWALFFNADGTPRP